MNRPFLKVSIASLKEITDVYEQQIYIYLKKNTNIAGFCSSSYSAIADAVGISRAKVISVIETLAQKEFIKKERVINSNGSFGINHYYLCDTPIFWQANKRKEMLDEFIKNHADFSADSDLSQAVSSPFVKVFYDFIESKRLNIREKSLYITLMRYRNSKTGFCFPSLKTIAAACDCCIKTAAKYIGQLVEKGFIKKDTYYNSKTSRRASCRYTLYDDAADEPPAASLEVSYHQKKRKKKDKSGTGKMDDGFWTDESVRAYYNDEEVNMLAGSQGIDIKYVDVAFDIIRHELNAKSETFRYMGEELPRKVIQAEYEKLTSENIVAALEVYLSQYNKIYNHEAYLKTLLYRIRNQSTLETVNTVQGILYNV